MTPPNGPLHPEGEQQGTSVDRGRPGPAPAQPRPGRPEPPDTAEPIQRSSAPMSEQQPRPVSPIMLVVIMVVALVVSTVLLVLEP